VNEEIQIINDKVKAESSFVEDIFTELGRVIVGQRIMIERLLVALLAKGHVLIEGVPGLAKTTTIKTLSDIIDTHFQRIQFTPDLLPADLLGTMIYNQHEGKFVTQKGPLFSNMILADEINRAPAKVQSALLEVMQERQITITGDTTYSLDDPFMVMATQNPIEQEGTYPLPEAQVDRFMLKITITYPEKQEELQILERMIQNNKIETNKIITPDRIKKARSVVETVYIDEKIKKYIIDLVFATRNPLLYNLDLKEFIEYGASPRATIYLALAAKAHAFIKRRGYVTPEDIKSIGPDILRHRIILTYEAEAEDITTDDIIQTIFGQIEVP
jgi:MoxR-like ATPase